LNVSAKPNHGGRLNEAAERWGIPVEQWVDLSTGINPDGWPVPDVPASVWQRLPEPDDGLAGQIRHWTGAPASAACVPVPGSQAAIMALPSLRSPCRVGVPEPGYQEHGYWWQQYGHTVKGIAVEQMAGADDRWLDTLDVLVCVNPNNPDGQFFPREQLMAWHQKLSERGGWLVVDEAFLTGPGNRSMAGFAGVSGLIVLRSLGKFFGLAGLRAGAVLTTTTTADALDTALGPWAVSGPARYLMARALADTEWQAATKVRLSENSQRLHRLLLECGLPLSSGTELYRYVRIDKASLVADRLASKGVLVRVFDNPPALRFGLPGSEDQWLKLERALSELGQSREI
jgi:cobalamin biosynthetic protein CobC